MFSKQQASRALQKAVNSRTQWVWEPISDWRRAGRPDEQVARVRYPGGRWRIITRGELTFAHR